MVRAFPRLLLLAVALWVPGSLPASTDVPAERSSALGTVLTLAPSSYREGVVYAATETGVFRSVDGGETWSPTGQGLPAGRVTSVAASPWNGEVAYATTHRGLYQTTNGGATWSAIGLHIPLFEIVLSPSSFEVLYASDGEIVYRSDEEGSLWTPASGGLPEVLLVAGLTVHPTDANTVYAATNLGLFKTTDGGGSWRAAGKDFGPVRSVAVDPKRPETVYAATGFKGIFKSRDGGITWAPASEGLPAEADVVAVSVDPTYPLTLFAAVNLDASGGIYRSRDGGATWQRVKATEALVRDIAVDPRRPDRVYAGVERLGLLRSEDGGRDWGTRDLPRIEKPVL
jgi:photosystem II stability/assembly factor-like uncharacterized protein